MQNYYGMAIRQHTNDLFAMRKSITAMLMHNTNFDDAETRHRYCPKNIASWCKSQKNILTREKTYKDHVNQPVLTKKEVDPISKESNNEPLNALIREKCLKDVYVSRNIT